MKRTLLVLIWVLMLMCLCGCRTVVVTSADELLSRNWQTETLSGLRGEIIFSDDSAQINIIPSTGDEVHISGALAVDSGNFYITSTEYCKTYTFAYKVYSDRAEITYGEDTLVFYPSEPQDVTVG